MKKSKIIIPALGVLVLSTAASITGTVAWFTANRAATVATGDFAVVNTDGALSYQVSAGLGTAAAKTDDSLGYYDKINLKSGVRLGDISFNPTTHTMWNDTGDGTAFRDIDSGTGYSEADSSSAKWYMNGTTYHAVSWDVTFTYVFGADTDDLNIFFDPAASTMTITDQDGATGSLQTGLGFRMAFMVGSTVQCVWSDNQTLANMKCVYNASQDPVVYSNANVGFTKVYDSASSASYARFADRDANQRSSASYLGAITSGAGARTLTVKCIAWYEGTDENVVSDSSKLQKVASSLQFYGRVNGANS